MNSHESVVSKLLALTAVALLFCSAAATAQTSSSAGSLVRPERSIWKFENTPNPAANNILLALSASSENNIWSVGDLVSLHFDGKVWTGFPVVDIGGESALNGVAAVSPTDVWAVGGSLENGQHFVSEIQHFDGQQWTLVPSPHFAGGDDLRGVQAISANDIFAVGSSNTDNPSAVSPLVEHWDGQRWTVVRTPQFSTGAELLHLAIISASDMWAVGDTGVLDNQQPTLPFAMHFDGKRWRSVRIPAQPKAIFNQLTGVTAIASNDVWAVGSAGPTENTTFTEHWDGHKWKVVPSPNGGKDGNLQGENRLFGVSAVSSNSVWASGFFLNPKLGTLHFLIEHWDGKQWTISPTPETITGFDTLHAVLAFPTGSVYVAGSDITVNSDLDSVILHTNKGR